ncbi:LysR family transcriptional regulator [Pseudomonas sp. HN11]|uniref:LysR family transcriptional regulator n=1 Tax=Pseudomonas sp. HN11 TaxID=1344094 RepID=UPI001F1862FF|nr:LysR family transcriptional regulator [Pseudomonas sp. HN11]UII70375.1 LysR family transcriptional regulator [Pseudomonas sp. HN11]
MASHEVLQAFVQAATQGSFSAAARKLGKSQSTVSAAVASLEIDLDVVLFDRSSRKPALTPAGYVLLQRAEQVLEASSRLELAASQLSQGLEPKLTIAMSDTYQSQRFEDAVIAFAERYPDLELEWLIAECDDLIDLVQSGRAQIAFIEQQDVYPPDLTSSPVQERTETALFVSAQHALASLETIDQQTLKQHRELRLASIVKPYDNRAAGRVWSAASYLMLMEMAQLGFGWAPLPRWLVERFGNAGMVELKVRGWPRSVTVDALWSRQHPPGPAGSWLLNAMLE